MTDEQRLNQSDLVQSGNRGLTTRSSTLVRRGLDLIGTLSRSPIRSWKTSDLYHAARVGFFCGGINYYKNDLDPADLFFTPERLYLDVDEEFLLTFMAHVYQRVGKPPRTFREKLAQYVLQPRKFTNPRVRIYNRLLSWVETLPEIYDKERPWDIGDPIRENVGYFLCGLFLFVQLQNLKLGPVLDIDGFENNTITDIMPFFPQLEEALPENKELRQDTVRGPLYHTTFSIWLGCGEFKRYLLRSAIKDLNLNRLPQAIDALDFLAPDKDDKVSHEYAKPLVIRAIASAISGDKPSALMALDRLPEDWRGTQEVEWFWSHMKSHQ